MAAIEWLRGLIQKSSGLVPRNLNPRSWIARQRDIKGGFHQYPYLKADDSGWTGDPNFPPSRTNPGLLDTYPEKMEKGMEAKVVDYPQAGTNTTFELIRVPIEENGEFPFDLSNEDAINYWKKFWSVKITSVNTSTRVYQYAPNATGGGAPPYPYELNTDWEVNWKNENVSSDGNKWYRFRTDDSYTIVNSIKIYNWTRPIPIGSGIEQGDYIDRRFARQDIDEAEKTSVDSLVVGKSYRVTSGVVTHNTIDYETGRIFVAANTDIAGTGSVREVVPVPPRSINGVPNNEPAGWYDDIADVPGTGTLWMIEAYKSMYGQLKETGWIGPKRIIENPNYLRYGRRATPNPNSIVNNKISGDGLTTWTPTSESAITGSTYDIELIANGWESTDDGLNLFIAYRSDDTPGYTSWQVEKIGEESGEFTDRAFKLFDINLDYDDAALVAPSNSDAALDGWSDVLLAESGTQINYISEARKFFDGTLKTPWSKPVPYTGQSVFNDVIVSDLGDNFKIAKDASVTPSLITLTAQLYRGVLKLWEQPGVTISFAWKKVYDNGAVVDIDPTTNSADDFYLLPSSGTPGSAGYLFANQRVGIKPGAVTGKAVFQCTMTLSMSQGDDIVFTEEFSVLDVSDGIDAKNLSVRAENQLIIYDTSNTVYIPATVKLYAYQSNLETSTFYWYKWNGASWDDLANGVDGYVISGNQLSISSGDLFLADGTAQEAKYALSTHATNPENADNVSTFSDYITIGKTGSAGVGSPGENAVIALLDNESHTVVLNQLTGVPLAGEIGSDGKATTILELWDGGTKKIYSTDYTIAVAPTVGDIQFAYTAQGNDVKIYIDSWASPGRSETCDITITYGAKTLFKKFSVSSVTDKVGATILDIDSDRGFAFVPGDSVNKTLTANFYHTAVSNEPITTVGANPIKYKWETISGAGDPITGSPNDATVTSYEADNRSIQITPGMVSNQLILRCSAIIGDDLTTVRTRTVYISDIPDGSMQRVYFHGTVAIPARPVGAYSSFPSSGASVWVTQIDYTHTGITWASDKSISASIWSDPYQIGGEKGDRGKTGDRIIRIYYDGAVNPGQPSPNDIPKASNNTYPAGWTTTIPSTVNDILWASEGRIDSETGYIVGTWSESSRFSGRDGQPGIQGNIGPGYNDIQNNGITTSGDRRITFVGVNGASNVQIDIPGGPGYISADNLGLDAEGNTQIRLNGYKGASNLTILIPPANAALEFWDNEIVIDGWSGIPNYTSWNIRFKKSKAGIVFFNIRWYKGDGGDDWIAHALGSEFATMIPSLGVNGSTKVIGGVTYTILYSFTMSGFITSSNIDRGSPGPAFIGRTGTSGNYRYHLVLFYNDVGQYTISGSYLV